MNVLASMATANVTDPRAATPYWESNSIERTSMTISLNDKGLARFLPPVHHCECRATKDAGSKRSTQDISPLARAESVVHLTIVRRKSTLNQV